jgi:hypothetical protein
MTARTRLAPALLLSIAACTAMRYDRPGAAAEQVAFDIGQCRDLAIRQSFYYPSYGFPFGPGYASHYPGAYLGYQNQIELDRLQYEHDLTEFCMRSRGYQLVPDTGQPPDQGITRSAPPSSTSPAP